LRLLLHTCCAPCSVAVAPRLAAEHELAAFFYNPNIHPYAEFSRRLQAMEQLATSIGLALTKREDYGLQDFLEALGSTHQRPARCQFCYRLRLGEAARFAAETGHEGLTSTLLVSPFQDREALGRIGQEEAARYGLQFLFPDLRPLFREGLRQAQQQDLYRQRYCGCIFSEYEAEEARRRRVSAR